MRWFAREFWNWALNRMNARRPCVIHTTGINGTVIIHLESINISPNFRRWRFVDARYIRARCQFTFTSYQVRLWPASIYDGWQAETDKSRDHRHPSIRLHVDTSVIAAKGENEDRNPRWHYEWNVGKPRRRGNLVQLFDCATVHRLGSRAWISLAYFDTSVWFDQRIAIH